MDLSPHELPLEDMAGRPVTLKLIGVGGGGTNAIDRLKLEQLDRLQLAVINTDLKALGTSPVPDKILIGTSLTRGLSAGGDPELGRKAAEADADKIAEIVKGTDLVFLVAGLGGGTGSGASPVVAEIAAEAGATVIAFVTLPFSFEGGRRLKQAEEGLHALRKVCDAVIPLPNDILLQEGAEDASVLDSFARADEWIGRGVKSIWAMLARTGLINVDFTALRQVFQHRGGKTLFGLGEGAGETCVADTIASLKLCPLLHTPEFSRKADRLLVNIIGGTDLTLPKVNELMTAITDQFGRESHVIMGAVIDESMQNRVEVCVIGTSDRGGRIGGARRPTPVPARATRTAAATTTEGPPVAGPAPATAQTAETHAAELAAIKVAQDEFGFGEIESRGYFEKTDRNLFDGSDLDVPTYLRKGIKITL